MTITGNSFDVSVYGEVKDIATRLEALERMGIDSDMIVMPDGTIVNPADLGIGDVSVEVFVQNDAPTGQNSTGDVGNLWYDTDDNNKLYWWDGFEWIAKTSGSPAVTGPPGIASMGPSLVAKNISVIDVTVSATAPISPTIGDLWKDTASGNIYKRWNGTAWVQITDSLLVDDLEKAITRTSPALDLTDNTFRIFYQNNPPVGLNATTNRGDLWYEADNYYAASTWTGTVWHAYATGKETTGTTDGLPPSSSPTPIITPGIGTIFIEWTPVTNADTVTYLVYMSTLSTVPTDSTTLLGETMGGTLFVARKLPNGAALAEGVTYYFRIIARDADGVAPASAVASGTSIAKITTTEISDGAVKTPQLFANAVTTDKIFSNAVTADKVAATAIDGKTITGALIRTDATANRGIKLDGFANTFKAWDAAGNETVSINGADGVVLIKGSLTSGSTITGTTITGSSFETSSDGANSVTLVKNGILQFNRADTGALRSRIFMSVDGLRIQGEDTGAGLPTLTLIGSTPEKRAVFNGTLILSPGTGIDFGHGGKVLRRFNGDVEAVTTNASGIATINHGLAVVPTCVVCTGQNSAGLQVAIESKTSNSFSFNLRSAAGALLASSTRTVNWIAIA